jgi:Zn-dependent protease with chaperone function
MKKQFEDISYRSFQHPLDREALAAVRKVKHIDVVIKKATEWSTERDFKILNLSDNIRLSNKQCPSIYKLLKEAASILDITQLPELYIDSSYTVNTYSYGIGNHVIVLCSGLIDIMSEDELLAVIGHELGHIKCNHMLYRTLAYLLSLGGGLLQIIPVLGKAVDFGVKGAIDEWTKMSTFTCDRSALLVVQDPEIVARMLAKLAGYSSNKILDEINIDEVLVQADEHEACSGKVDKLIKFIQNRNQVHPLPIVRVKKLIQWAESEEYKKIMDGDYLKTGDIQASDADDIGGNFKDTEIYSTITERAEQVSDAIDKKTDEISSAASEAKKKLENEAQKTLEKASEARKKLETEAQKTYEKFGKLFK